MTTLPDTVETNAAKPRAVTVDGQPVEQQSLKDQIEAAKMAASNAAIAGEGNSTGNGKFGVTFFKFRPPGA
jgi:hypothetical protein